MSSKAWAGGEGSLATRLLLTVPLAESGPPAVKAEPTSPRSLASLGCLLATRGLCLDAPLGPDLREGQSCLQTQGYCWSPVTVGVFWRGRGCSRCSGPSSPTAACGSRGPTRFCCSIESCKGAGRQKKKKHKRRTTYQGTHIPDTWMHLFHGLFFNESTSHYLIGTREFLRLFGPEAFSQQLNFEVQETVWGSYMGLKRSN